MEAAQEFKDQEEKVHTEELQVHSALSSFEAEWRSQDGEIRIKSLPYPKWKSGLRKADITQEMKDERERIAKANEVLFNEWGEKQEAQKNRLRAAWAKEAANQFPGCHERFIDYDSVRALDYRERSYYIEDLELVDE